MPKKLLSLLCAALLLLSTLNVPALAADDPINPTQEPLPYQGESIKNALLADVKTPDDPALQKLDSALLPLADDVFLPEGITQDQYKDQIEAQGDSQVTNSASREGTDAAEVYVYITIKKGTDPSSLLPYVNRIDNHNDTLVVAWVGMDRLAALAAVDCVINISQVTAPVVYKMDTSEGVGLHKADLAQALSNGAGVKVGIISDGVRHMASAVASGDLPGNVTVLNDRRGGDEGTAMLEIVYDMAPGAQLFFHDSGNSVLDFNDAVDALITAGCSIVVDDVGWITEPFFEDGVIAKHYKEIVARNNVLFISAAGNAAEDHYQGIYYDSSSFPGWEDFSNGTSAIEDIRVRVFPGSNLKVILQWKEPFGSSNLSDYDLYLTNTSGTYTYTKGIDPNSVTMQPMETISFSNTSSTDMFFAISVSRYNAPTPRELEIYIYGAYVDPTNIVQEDSIFGQAAVPGVIACGAINPTTPNSIETFSSQGPVTTLTETRNKPDICGADGVNVTGAGGFPDPFYGTSAAAPHVAAIAALVKARFPQYTPSQIANLLTSNCTDLGAAGYDSVFGNGLSNALAAVCSSYYVRFDSQGGSAADTQLIASGATIAKPADPVYAGHQFGGWFKEAECIHPWNFAADAVNADTTLFAKWDSLATYTVSFDAQGGGSVAPVTARAGSGIAAPATPIYPGHIFGGWYKDIACTAPWNFSADTVTGDMTLYAGWTLNSFTVNFDTQGGSAIAAMPAGYGATIAAPATPTRSGYTFTGWFQDINCTWPWHFDSDTVTNDTTLFAGWAAQTPSNYLRGIALSAGGLTKGFSAKTTSYTVNLGENDAVVTISPAKAYDMAAMTIDGKAVPAKTIALANGKSATVTVKVTWNKKSTTYKLKVQRAKSTANTLAALNASTGTWSQPFDPAVTSYTLALPENVGKVSLSAVRASGMATVSPAKGSFALKNGQTVKATFKVKAQSGATRTYTVLITRAKSTNANLSSLKLNAKGMAPGFSPAITGYAITLPAKTASVTIAAKAADKLSTVRINGAKKASLAVKLANGQSATVTVTVTAQSGDVKSYNI